MQREQVLLCESDRWKLEKMGNEPDNTTYLTYNKRYTIKTMSLLPIPTKLYYYTQASEEHASLSLSLSLSLCVCEWCWVLQHELFCLSRVSRGSKLRSTFPQRTKNTGYQAHVGQNFTFFCNGTHVEVICFAGIYLQRVVVLQPPDYKACNGCPGFDPHRPT
jgi:hypothetical protein